MFIRYDLRRAVAPFLLPLALIAGCSDTQEQVVITNALQRPQTRQFAAVLNYTRFRIYEPLGPIKAEAQYQDIWIGDLNTNAMRRLVTVTPERLGKDYSGLYPLGWTGDTLYVGAGDCPLGGCAKPAYHTALYRLDPNGALTKVLQVPDALEVPNYGSAPGPGEVNFTRIRALDDSICVQTAQDAPFMKRFVVGPHATIISPASPANCTLP